MQTIQNFFANVQKEVIKTSVKISCADFCERLCYIANKLHPIALLLSVMPIYWIVAVVTLSSPFTRIDKVRYAHLWTKHHRARNRRFPALSCTKTGSTQPKLSAACFVVQSCLADADFVIFLNYCLVSTRLSLRFNVLFSQQGRTATWQRPQCSDWTLLQETTQAHLYQG